MHEMRFTAIRRTALAVALLSLTTLLGAQTTPAPASPAPEWKSYSYPAEGFSITFPSVPAEKKQNVPTDAGTFELRAYLSEIGEAALYVGICDYGSAVSGRTSDAVLEGARGGALQNTNSHLISTKKITLGLYPGVEFEAENATMHFSARIYLVGTSLYQTLTAAPLDKPYTGTTRFLDSFQLIARVAK